MISSQKFILVYHGIGDENKFLQVSEHSFKQQVTYLLNVGFTFVSVERMLGATGKYASLVFDDGFLSIKKVYNFLKLENIFFGVSVIVDSLRNGSQNNYLTSQELYELQNCEFYSHGCRHIDLTGLSVQELRRELLESKNYIETMYIKKVQTFVYPYGKYNDMVIKEVKQAGYDFGMGLLPFHISSYSDHLVLPRLNINGNVTFEKFRFLTSKMGNIYLHTAFLKRKMLRQSYLTE